MQDIGWLKDNYKYYDGFEGEAEVVLRIKEEPTIDIHIWRGYFGSIFGDPLLHGLGWYGFTRDYNELKGAFGLWGDEEAELSNLEEYLQDMMQYKGKDFRFEDTREVFNLIIEFLQYAINTKQTVIMEAD